MTPSEGFPAVKPAGEIEMLVGDLQSADAVRRDAAIGRLRVIGGRAVARLAVLATSDAPAPARCAALSALEGIDDRRVVDPALTALSASQPSDIAGAAIGVLRAWLLRESGTRVLDALAAVAVDESRPADVRRAALDTLSTLPPDLVEPIRERAGHLPGGPAATGQGTASTDDAAAARSRDPAAARDWLAAHGADAPLSALHDLVVHARERQQGEASATRRAEWLAARGAAHAALARRGSRVALYDLREAFDAGREPATAPLPLDFLTAVTLIGDASCLEPMARHWASSPHDAWWRERLESAAAAIMHRIRLSGRSAVVRRLRAKWSGFV